MNMYGLFSLSRTMQKVLKDRRMEWRPAIHFTLTRERYNGGPKVNIFPTPRRDPGPVWTRTNPYGLLRDQLGWEQVQRS